MSQYTTPFTPAADARFGQNLRSRLIRGMSPFAIECKWRGNRVQVAGQYRASGGATVALAWHNTNGAIGNGRANGLSWESAFLRNFQAGERHPICRYCQTLSYKITTEARVAERSFAEEVEHLKLGDGDVFRGEGILAITKALLQSGVSYVGGYQGSPISHLMDVLNDANDILDDLGVVFQSSASEASAAAMLSASVMYPLRGAVAWKSTVGTNLSLIHI